METTSTSSSSPSLPKGVVPVVPMRNVVLFPHVLLPVTVGRPRSLAAVQYATETSGPIGVLLQKDATVDDPTVQDLCVMGTLAKVIRRLKGADGQYHLVCQGLERFRVVAPVEGYPFLAVHAQPVSEPSPASAEAEALALQLRERASELMSLLPAVPAELAQAIQETRDASSIADAVASLLDAQPAEKQQLLETTDTEQRLHKVLEIVAHRVQVLRLSQEISARTKEQFDDRQRRFLLQEQLKAIQKELGEGTESDEEIARLEQAIAQAGMPEEVETQARKELRRLQRMGDTTGEYSMLRTYLEWMTELPWRTPPETAIDLDVAREVLEAQHFGLERVKQRILEFLAVQKLNPTGRSPILCFVGPPGVGKTSLGQSIARALQRPFVRVSLGGVHDEAEIRGHRRTYIGAMPGNIVQSLRKAGARHCVMMLDEVDKMSASLQGDPSAALLEVLDPEQNSTFRDNYLGVPFDLSRVVFIATANVIDNVPPPVRDRMEVIELPGYTEEEKLQIAQRYLVQRQREANGLREDQCEIELEALRALVTDYTREAGVRQLEREVGRVMRHAAMCVAQGRCTSVRVHKADLEAILGPAKFEHETALRSGLPGVATGLAWTPVGGDILFIEATRVAGSGRLILTGQLGDVMKESAQAALTLIKARAPELRVPAAMFDGIDLHLHVPAGAIPKDGPSAGIAMFVALASLFTDRPVRHDVAMTGEISLRGLVLPVGGIKEKVLAALRAGVSTVMLPRRNRKDLHEVPASAQEALRFVWLDTVDDAVTAALGDPSTAGSAGSFRLV
ncbi:endopeptidase La [Caldimonas aquatica]|uniref:Lon protease n=1 Tax=Caldimonas aquatica TaxID=376175 RepID=A0ABY6MQ51_9BURK|nr:endopeptidase La [Schlegelella aquatica]UZD53572.1 endopeptidase La [Schlegelella aquatica]